MGLYGVGLVEARGGGDIDQRHIRSQRGRLGVSEETAIDVLERHGRSSYSTGSMGMLMLRTRVEE